MLAGTMLLMQMILRPRQVVETRSIPREQQKGLSISTSRGPAAFCTASTHDTTMRQCQLAEEQLHSAWPLHTTQRCVSINWHGTQAAFCTASTLDTMVDQLFGQSWQSLLDIIWVFSSLHICWNGEVRATARFKAQVIYKHCNSESITIKINKIKQQSKRSAQKKATIK